MTTLIKLDNRLDFGKKPVNAISLDYSHPLIAEQWDGDVFMHAPDIPRGLHQTRSATLGTGITYAPSTLGMATYGTPQSATTNGYIVDINPRDWGQLTIAVVTKQVALPTGSNENELCRWTSSSSQGIALALISSGGTYWLRALISTSGTSIWTAGQDYNLGNITGKDFVIAVSWDGATRKMYAGEVGRPLSLLRSDTCTGVVNYQPGASFVLHGGAHTAATTSGYQYLSIVKNSSSSKSELDSFSKNIGGIFKPSLSAFAFIPSGASSNDRTGTAAATLALITALSSGTFVTPEFSATAIAQLGNITASASASTATPASSGIAAGSLFSITATSSAQHAVPDYTATATGALATLTGAATATGQTPDYTATATGVISAITGASSAGSEVPGYPGTSAGQLQSITATASAQFATPAFTSTAAGSLIALAGSAAGEVVTSGIVATVAGLLSQINGQASAASVVPSYTGGSVAILGSLTATANAQFYTDDVTGVASGVINSITGVANAEVVNPFVLLTTTNIITMPVRNKNIIMPVRDRTLILT